MKCLSSQPVSQILQYVLQYQVINAHKQHTHEVVLKESIRGTSTLCLVAEYVLYISSMGVQYSTNIF